MLMHYENTPMQYTDFFFFFFFFLGGGGGAKMKNFTGNILIFFLFLLKILIVGIR